MLYIYNVLKIYLLSLNISINNYILLQKVKKRHPEREGVSSYYLLEVQAKSPVNGKEDWIL
ncbi:hypothetical protein DU80_10470 [Methanosarcina mazei]|uniref:Uncharacterized protein n=1 Tax=Methanosarcina mazei TaxID=2209 RepID=A0A0F8CFF6_METMZ|nr:hypothetical protein DU40_04930 [Methanosarcina mazei]KKG03589.1 hypothetical protein DU31_15760 [Methanosarcina mazei]KKG06847.1 hypothetical protein DU47_10535 [Methanosarcina mazei]KKG11941.1 hypothetical protein DU34_16230 [Methanosarcina mazei]KKG30710.1 hypothetical protein DU30_03770 [Methanosarcina mazei]